MLLLLDGRLCPHPPQIVASCGRFYTTSPSSDGVSIPRCMEKREAKRGDLKGSNNSLNINRIMGTELKRHLSDMASYKKRVFRDFMFSVRKYDKLIRNNLMKNNVEKEEKNRQISDARLKLMKQIPQCIEQDMGWWSRCEDEE